MLVGESAVTELPEDVVKAILEIIRRGNDAEVKKVNGQIVVVEIRRKVTKRTAITG